MVPHLCCWSSQVLVGEEALRKKLQIYERENEALRRKLDEVQHGAIDIHWYTRVPVRI